MNKRPVEDYQGILSAIDFGQSGSYQAVRSAPIVKALYEAEDCGRCLGFSGIVMRGQYFGEVQKEEDVKKTITIELAHIRLMNASEGLKDLVKDGLVSTVGADQYRLPGFLLKVLDRTLLGSGRTA